MDPVHESTSSHAETVPRWLNALPPTIILLLLSISSTEWRRTPRTLQRKHPSDPLFKGKWCEKGEVFNRNGKLNRNNKLIG